MKHAHAILAILLLPATNASASGELESLARALARFQGVGYEDVTSYRVELSLPDPEEESVPLREVWHAPHDLVLMPADSSVPAAIVRSLALYLEPLYVARSSLLEADLDDYAKQLGEEASVEGTPRDGGGRRVHLRLPENPENLPAVFHDLVELNADLDAGERLERLELRIRSAAGANAEQRLSLECTYDEGHVQPTFAKWSLPNGDEVRIETTFSNHDGKALPETRRVTFPSRYDPGDVEEIFVQYENFELNAEIDPEELGGKRVFRYDENGLVTD